MAYTEARISDIIEELRGSCKSIDECLEDGEDRDDPALLAAIDEHIFECETCGWWNESSEDAGGDHAGMCVDCADAGEENGDDA